MEQQLAHYQIEELLGEGSFAVVYRAFDQKFERPVALKVLKPVWQSDPQAVQRFDREAKTVARLRHPHIIDVYDVGQAGGQLFLAQLLVEGETLAARLQRGRLAWTEMLVLLQPLASALDYAHGQGIIHRDLKPSNILLDQDGTAFLGDFGLVRAAEGSAALSTSAGGMIGTPAYMAPEQWQGQPATAATDVYALSCIVVEMLTGQVLFDGSTPAMAVYQHTVAGPTLPARWPADVPAGLDRLLEQALAREPADRYQTAGALGQALTELPQTAARVGPTEAPGVKRQDPAGPAPPPRSKPPQQSKFGGIKSPLILGIVGVMLCVVGLGAFTAFVMTRNQSQPAETAGPTGASPAPAAESREQVATADSPDVASVEALANTATPTPTFTPIPPLPTATVPAEPLLTTRADLNVRRGPAPVYDLAGLLPAGAETRILGRDPSGEWWQIRFEPAPDGRGWVSAGPEFSTAINIDNIPVVQPPPTPTGTPTRTPPPTPTPTPRPPTRTPTPQPALGVGSGRARQADGMTMVYVPAGTFMMGSDDSDALAQDDEKPAHAVTLAAFWLDRTEVTNAMYNRCVEAGACSASEYADDSNYNGGDYPVVGVSWDNAVDYCDWAGGRLPTEAEWEYAARGPDSNTYPWGEEPPTCNLAQYGGCEGNTRPVGSLPAGASWVGARDMSGNVWEWVTDWYGSDYYQTSPAENPTGPDSGDWRVLRGGSWSHYARNVRAAYRDYNDPLVRNDSHGFRCVVSPGN